MSQSVSVENLSEKEIASRLGVSLSTIRRWRRNGTGPGYFKFGGVLRYAKSSLDAFIKQHTKATA